jgi:hypothetical protein
LVQEFQEPPSIRHSKVEPDSVEVKSNVGFASFDGSGGWAVIVVLGAVVSTVQV